MTPDRDVTCRSPHPRPPPRHFQQTDGQLVYGLKRRRLIVTLAAHTVRLDCLGPNNEGLSGHRDRVVLDNVYLLALYNTRTKMIRNGVANLRYKHNDILPSV